MSALSLNGFPIISLGKNKHGIYEAEITDGYGIIATGSGHLPMIAFGNSIIDMDRQKTAKTFEDLV